MTLTGAHATTSPTCLGPGSPPTVDLMERLMVAPEILRAVHGDRTILLDLRAERYLGLDEVGTAVWDLIARSGECGITLPQVVEAIEAEFAAPRALLETELGSLLDRLRRDRVVQCVKTDETSRPSRPPSTVRCSLTLLGAVLALRLLGLRRSLGLARRLSHHVRPAQVPTPEFMSQVVRRVDVAAAFFPGRALCLEQAFALHLLLRQVGVAARLRIGVQPYPFAAHAWVEYEGEPVGESYDQVGRFVPFDGLRA